MTREATRDPSKAAVRTFSVVRLVLGAALAVAVAPTTLTVSADVPQAMPHQAPGWSFDQASATGVGVRGARWPAVDASGDDFAFTHDGDLAPAAPGNADGSGEVFEYRRGVGIQQVTDTGRSGTGGDPASVAVSADGSRIAFVSASDLTGGNADGSREVFIWDSGSGFTQVTSASAGAAESVALSADGVFVAFWHSGNLSGANDDGSLELYRARIGGPAEQLTDLTVSPFHSRPTIDGDGDRVAFVLEADLTGANGDLSWELFLWQGPPSQPGDASRFSQVTDWRPPMTGRELYDPSISDAGDAIAFAGAGHVDVSQPGSHQEKEIYLWTETAGIQRLTTATAPNRSSTLPHISGDGTHVAFVSLADLDPGSPGNTDRNTELFIWSSCAPIMQVTDSAARPLVIASEPALSPSANRTGTRVGFLSENATDVAPLVLPSRLGIAFLALESPETPCQSSATATPSPSPGPATPIPTPAPTSGPTPAPGSGAVCPQMIGRIPAAVQAFALANPEEVYGWFLPRNPSRPPGPANPMRRWLSLRDPGKAYSWTNPAVWKAGCP